MLSHYKLAGFWRIIICAHRYHAARNISFFCFPHTDMLVDCFIPSHGVSPLFVLTIISKLGYFGNCWHLLKECFADFAKSKSLIHERKCDNHRSSHSVFSELHFNDWLASIFHHASILSKLALYGNHSLLLINPIKEIHLLRLLFFFFFSIFLSVII